MFENCAYNYFCYKLFKNKNDQMIIITNLRDIYSKLYRLFNICHKILDNKILYI